MARLSTANQPLDIITVSETMDSDGELQKVGGLTYLAEIARNTPSAANLLHYARIVRERSSLRQMIHTAHEIADTGYKARWTDQQRIARKSRTTVYCTFGTATGRNRARTYQSDSGQCAGTY